MRGSLDRDALIELLDELSKRLRHARVRAHIYIVGGAAMTLAFRRDRTTHDVDARVDSGHSALTDAVREIARERRMPESWLNEQATSFIPQKPDTRAPTLYDSPYLVVTGASAEHMLAMKLESARDTDENDIRTLIQQLEMTTADDALHIHDELFPDTPIGPRGRALLQKILPRTP